MVQDSEPRPFGTGVQRVTEEGVTTPVFTPFAGLSVPVSTSTPVDVDEDDEVIEIDVGEGPSTQKGIQIYFKKMELAVANCLPTKRTYGINATNS